MKINKRVFIHIFVCILMIIPFFIPPYLEYKYNWLSLISNVLLGLVILVVVFECIKEKKINNFEFLIFYIIFLLLELGITILNRGDYLTYIKNILKYIMMFLLYNVYIKKYGKDFLRANVLYFSVLLIINLFYILRFPEGLYTNNVNNWGNWFLGYKNSFILYMIPAILFSRYLDILDNKKLSFSTLFVMLISFLTIILIDSSTGLIGLGILSLGIIFNKSISKIKIFNFKNIIILHLILFFLIIIFRMQEIFTYFIKDILNRDLNFTNRTRIWDTALNYIKAKPILGYGYESTLLRTIKFNYLQAVECHNQLLDWLYQAGITGIFVISVLLKKIKNYIDRIDNEKLKTLSLIAILTFTIMMLSEYYKPSNYIFILAIIINLNIFNKKDEIADEK